MSLPFQVFRLSPSFSLSLFRVFSPVFKIKVKRISQTPRCWSCSARSSIRQSPRFSVSLQAAPSARLANREKNYFWKFSTHTRLDCAAVRYRWRSAAAGKTIFCCIWKFSIFHSHHRSDSLKVENFSQNITDGPMFVELSRDNVTCFEADGDWKIAEKSLFSFVGGKQAGAEKTFVDSESCRVADVMPRLLLS